MKNNLKQKLNLIRGNMPSSDSENVKKEIRYKELLDKVMELLKDASLEETKEILLYAKQNLI